MAQSPSHTWGQTIGTVVERSVVPTLGSIAREYSLYLDSPSYRPARKGRKVTWVDKFGNRHDLDYVFERSGSHVTQGTPVGFVEVAWRRYTKHSKNKAQEIQGAILPLVETYHAYAPFMAAIIAGEFTAPAIDQLRSLDFRILYFPYEVVVEAFNRVGITASYNEATEDREFQDKIQSWKSLSVLDQQLVESELIDLSHDEVEQFKTSLREALGRNVLRIVVIPLYGSRHEFKSADDALEFLSSDSTNDHHGREPIRVEVEVHYTNGDRVTGSHQDAKDAAEFLDRILDVT